MALTQTIAVEAQISDKTLSDAVDVGGDIAK
jgi:hypothetical protein